MNHAPIDAIMKRLDFLERQNRLLKRWGIPAFAASVAILLCAGTVFQDDVQVMDRKGRVRGFLYSHTQAIGDSGLHLFDANGVKRVALGVAVDGSSGIWVLDRNGVTRIGIGVDAVGRTYLRIFDARGVEQDNLAPQK